MNKKINQTTRRLPPWIKIRLSGGGSLSFVHAALKQCRLNTVCESAHCPNRHECFQRGTATIMLLGTVCTRNCKFCAVESGTPLPPDPDEARRAAELVRKLSIRHAVITSVTRDDLPDGGASTFAAAIAAIRTVMGHHTTIEVLTPDFKGSFKALDTVLNTAPEVFNHNLETVKRLQKLVRPQAGYEVSLAVIKHAATSGNVPVIKSGLMAGMGESDDEIFAAMQDLLAAGCRHLTIGQYLAPSERHWPVDRFVPPDKFAEYRARALEMGYREVAAGPLVRSSYMAESFLQKSTANLYRSN